MKPEKISELVLGKRSNGKDNHWIELYLAEFPVEEQRDVDQLRGYLESGAVVLHETRTKDGQLLTWSMSQDYPADSNSGDPSFWLGCWTVTRRSAQSSGVGRLHLPCVIAALKSEKPGYIGRFTEIESTEGLPNDSQPVRRARFYQALGMSELNVSYEIPLYQPVDSKVYVPQAQLGKGINGQLLFAPFTEAAVTATQVRSILSRIYQTGYDVDPQDPYIAARLALVNADLDNYLTPIRIMATSQKAGTTESGPKHQTVSEKPAA